MTDKWSYPEALRELWDRSNYERGYIANPFGDAASGKRGLARVRALLHLAGDPDHRQPIVHVAGSKGKGSTAAMIDAVGSAARYRVGLYTSPHLHSYRERIVVGDSPITEPAFAHLTQRIASLSSRLEAQAPDLGRVTTFELLTVMALAHCAETSCDLVVLEVGLGGTYDATNVVTPAVSIITTLDLEHTAVLGPTLADIATAKAGIIKQGVPVVVSPQPRSIVEIFSATAARHRSPLLIGGRDWHTSGTWRDFAANGPWGAYSGLSSGLPGRHQVENAATAIAATTLLTSAGIVVSEDDIRRGLRDVRLPGRFERMALANGTVAILDGAHTPASVRALTETIQSEYPGRGAIVILGTSSDKDVATLGRALRPITADMIATKSVNPRAAQPDQVAAGLSGLSIPVSIEPTVPQAVARARAHAGPGDLIVITGSLFVVADARGARPRRRRPADGESLAVPEATSLGSRWAVIEPRRG